MDRTLAIRRAKPSDVPTIARLIRALAEYERLAEEVTMTEDVLAESLFGDRAYAETLLAEDNGEPVGFALFFHNFSTFRGKPGIYLEDLFVMPEHRGGGVGGALFERLASIAVERGCERFEWAVLDWNADAIGFYERLGARPNADWTIYRLSGEALRQLASPSRP